MSVCSDQQEVLVAEKQGFINHLSAPGEQAVQDLNGDVREDGFQTEGRIVAAVERDGLVLRQVPLSARTARVCRAAVGNCGMALGAVPETLKTENLCLTAIGQDGLAICHVPRSVMTERVCRASVEKGCFNIQFVPMDLMTEDICKAAVEQNGLALSQVPLSARTAEVCRTAVGNCGFALGYVPGELKTVELCLAAVRSDGTALEYVPDALKTRELCLAAVRSDGTALEYVPDALKTRELCLAAVANGGEKALKYVPEELKDDVCLAVAVAEERDASFDASGKSLEDVKAGGAGPEFVRNAEPSGTQATFEWLVQDSSLDRLFVPLGVQEAVLLDWVLAAGLAAAMHCKSVVERATDHDAYVCGPVSDALTALKLMRDVAARDAQLAGAPADDWQTVDHVNSFSLSDAVRVAVASTVRPVGSRAGWACQMLFSAAEDGVLQVMKDFSKWGGSQESPDGGLICEIVSKVFYDLAFLAGDAGSPYLSFINWLAESAKTKSA